MTIVRSIDDAKALEGETFDAGDNPLDFDDGGLDVVAKLNKSLTQCQRRPSRQELNWRAVSVNSLSVLFVVVFRQPNVSFIQILNKKKRSLDF